MNTSSAIVLTLLTIPTAKASMSRRDIVKCLAALGSTSSLTRTEPTGWEPIPQATLERLRAMLEPDAVAAWQATGEQLAHLPIPVSVSTILDETYPANLRTAKGRPPFLFAKGSLSTLDPASIAVVGTRHPTCKARAITAGITTDLCEAGVTIVSGLAAGIDTVAHTTAIACNGKTVAVLGHGIRHPVFPVSNRPLADEILSQGGVIVSQFWPDQPPNRTTFPKRNVTTSGMSCGTVVVEAGERSGARLQARLCREQGRLLFLTRRLVDSEAWAKRDAGLPGVRVFRTIGEILATLKPVDPSAPVQHAFAEA